MRFELKAISPDGRIESLDFQALDESSARQQAKERGYTVIELRRKSGLPRGLAPGPALSGGALFAGAARAARSRAAARGRDPDARRRRSAAPTSARCSSGSPRRCARGCRSRRRWSSTPHAFSPLYVATVRATERTSDLAPALARYVAYENQLDAVRKRLVNASIYPLLLVGVGGLVSLFLMLYVVPRFSRIYEERAADLPLFSKLLLAWGQLIEGHGVLVLRRPRRRWPSPSIQTLRTASVRARISNALWRLPAVGERMKVYQLARFYRTIGNAAARRHAARGRARHGGGAAASRAALAARRGAPRDQRRAAGLGLDGRRTASRRRWRCACSWSASTAATWAR